jgi:hypothetical protein
MLATMASSDTEENRRDTALNSGDPNPELQMEAVQPNALGGNNDPRAMGIEQARQIADKHLEVYLRAKGYGTIDTNNSEPQSWTWRSLFFRYSERMETPVAGDEVQYVSPQSAERNLKVSLEILHAVLTYKITENSRLAIGAGVSAAM